MEEGGEEGELDFGLQLHAAKRGTKSSERVMTGREVEGRET